MVDAGPSTGAGARRGADAASPWRVEGSDSPPAATRKRGLRGWRAPGGRRFWLLVALLLSVNIYVSAQITKGPERVGVPYTFFRDQVESGHVADVTTRGDMIQGEFKPPVAYPAGSKDNATRFQTTRPSFADDDLFGLLVKKNVTVNAKAIDQGRPLWLVLITSILPTLAIVALFLIVSRSMGGGLLRLGRSRAKLYDASAHRTNFEDVAGIDEAEEELAEIVSFLRDPGRYWELGAEMPRGVLLSGLPGTGKTLLARAVAGEADVPFYSLSASEFIEMVVGVGASRVRDLFNQAKQNAPAIIFIDELDAIGRARGGSGGRAAGHDEREQTLNQILVEMDGFSGSEGVIVLAATNRPEILDPALLRPGRFDRRVTVNPPDAAGRERILAVHTRRVPLSADVDLRQVAGGTSGMVGAELKNLVNEAALAAARRGSAEVSLIDFGEALEKIVLGAERRITLSPSERERTAYHEAGHAVLGMLEPGADQVRRVSIVPRAQSLGVTFQSSETDRHAYDADYLRGRIIGALGGRAAEELVYGKVTTGAESDLAQVTRIARQMVGRWGMSKAVGLVSVVPGPGEESRVVADAGMAFSPATGELVDLEVRRIVAECYEAAVHRLRDNRPRLDALAAALLEHETLDEEAAYSAAGFEPGRVADSGHDGASAADARASAFSAAALVTPKLGQQ
ncbi:MAG TPA: ATP-dependent zinc metalloprotease FtsH [Thermoleophilaceae bacterium]